MADASSTSKPKKSFFAKPAWATAQPKAEPKKESDIFSHAQEAFAEIQREKERVKKEDAVKRDKKGKRKSEESHSREDIKRSRHSLESSRDPSESRHSARDTKKGIKESASTSPVRQSPRNSKSLSRKYNAVAQAKPKSSTVIDLGDSDSDDLQITAITPSIVKPETDADAGAEDVDSDPEFSKMRREAAERKRRREEQAANGSLGSLDAIVHILVFTQDDVLPPLKISLKLGGELGRARRAYLSKAEVDEESWGDYILVFRNMQVFDTSNCASLGITIDELGNPSLKGTAFSSGGNDIIRGDDLVVMECMRASDFERQKAEEERRRNAPPVEEQEEEEPQEEVIKIKVLLKAKGYPDKKYIVRMETLVSKLIEVFSDDKPELSGRAVSIVLEGDVLNEDERMQDIDIDPEELNCFEVHVK
ncbi:hypothetical protein K402DRAFT_465162 [Aulographum hederae CBS 113979]|uniref:Ubiquitin-like domain-containing protein n=1 Tax=Aulographum hederae CBS 113979 TaxID=1176131 RepID=A0A6G1GUL0_9PEZI|nr:hypothetical protein K402DRAFT_465162 [Aulographum hederae CBS 113979]